jgi:hypothetical protein
MTQYAKRQFYEPMQAEMARIFADNEMQVVGPPLGWVDQPVD